MDITYIKKENTSDCSITKVLQQEPENENEPTQEEYIFVKPELEDGVVGETNSAQDPLSLDSGEFEQMEESGLQRESFVQDIKYVRPAEDKCKETAQDLQLTPNGVGCSRGIISEYKVPNEDSYFVDDTGFHTVTIKEERNFHLEAEGSGDTECEEQTVTCNSCRKGFPSRKAMVGHTCEAADVVSREGAALPANACTACGEVLATAELARRHPRSAECPHNRQVTGGRPREMAEPGKFACDHCTARYGRRSHLIRHLRVHSGVRAFPCPTCGKAFLDPSALKAHEATHSNDRLIGSEGRNTFS